ncbi:MAG: NAD-dependent succinate-semialdehyde dehydrogenase [Planctomycetota bacterium]
MGKMTAIDPATEEVIESFATLDEGGIEEALAIAPRAAAGWAARPLAERIELLRAVARRLREETETLAAHATAEMGKPLAESRAEVEKCAWACDHYAEHGEELMAPRPHPSSGSRAYVAFRPLGTIFAIMPWNYPYWQVFRCAAPALLAGNGVLLKHASNVPRCAIEIEGVLRRAGLPEGVFQTLLVGGAEAERIVADPRVSAVSLTGSEHAGAKVAAAAGREIKRTLLELGGSDPFIVLRDADVAAAAKIAVKARFQNAGQSCIAAKRFLVEAPVLEEFTEAFGAELAGIRVGDPRDPETKMGPLARRDLRDGVRDQLKRALSGGARVVARGEGDDRERGYFMSPVIVRDDDPRSPLRREEVFGPVAPIVSVASADEAIAIANETIYGLGASVWTQDIARAEKIAGCIVSGQVFINGMVASDPRLPFGGVKHSGYGRELSELGLRELVNEQTVWIA